MKELKILELFGGIGACTKALERQNILHKVVDYVEIDKYAVKSYNAVHRTDFGPQDITKWDKDIQVDLIMHGSPCQDFSVAGKGAGGDKGSGTRSSLLYETLRIVDKLRPKYVIWENVKNLLSKKHVHNWEAYAERMEEMGYTNYCQVLNAKNYGVPQNRERAFTVSIRLDVPYATFFEFPEPILLEKRLKDVLDDEVDESFDVSQKQLEGMAKTNYQSYKLSKLLKDKNDIADTIKARFIGCPQLVKRNNNKIRKLTPKECWRLMGFDDADIEKAQAVGISNAQLYKQAGNSIVVNVLEAILSNLMGVER